MSFRYGSDIMIRIWFNHWFSTAYNIINLIKSEVGDFIIIGSNEHSQSPIRKVCDEWYQEPVLKGDEYVSYCLEFCKVHNIDVFLPRREMIQISKRKELFTQLGVKVLVDDYQYVSLFNDKAKTYEALSPTDIVNIPDFYVVNSSDMFFEAYQTLSRKYRWVCYKFVHDEGGKSFRLIDNSKKGYTSLFKKQTTRISYDDCITALDERKQFASIMVMPFLPDEEVSVDCLNTKSGLIAIPRVKDYSRIERIFYDQTIIEACKRILSLYPLEYPCNIQFKYLNGTPYFLEVNTRMSGGVQMACSAAEVNIPGIAVKKLLGIENEWKINQRECSVTHVEIPIVL